MATSEWLLNQFEIYNKEIAPFSLQEFRFLKVPRMISSRAAWSEITTAYRQIIDPNDTRRQGRFSLVAMDYLMELKAKGYDSIKNSLDEQPQVEKIFGKGASFGFANNGLGNEKQVLFNSIRDKVGLAFLDNQADRYDESEQFTYTILYGEEMKITYHEREFSAEDIVKMWNYFWELDKYDASRVDPWTDLPNIDFSLSVTVDQAGIYDIWNSEKRDARNRKATFGFPETKGLYKLTRVEALQRVRAIYRKADPVVQFDVMLELGLDPDRINIDIR